MKQDPVLFELRLRKSIVYRCTLLTLPLIVLLFFGINAISQVNATEPVVDFFPTMLPLVERPNSPLVLAGEQNFGTALLGLVDFNEDGYDDLVVSRDNVLQVRLGDEDGQFGVGPVAFYASKKVPQKGGFVRVEPLKDENFIVSGQLVSDLNRDGHLDIAVVNEAFNFAKKQMERRLYVFFGDGSGALEVKQPPLVLASAELTGTSEAFEFTMISDDFDGDGLMDLLFVRLRSNDPDTFLLLRGLEDNVFALPQPIDVVPVSEPIEQAISSDFNGDGKTDLALQTFNSITFYFRQDRLNFEQPLMLQLDPGKGLGAFAVADVTGDGLYDVAGIVDGRTVNVYQQDAGEFLLLNSYKAEAVVNNIAAGDFNADGQADLALFSNGEPSVSFAFGDGRGNFAFSERPEYILFEFPKEVVVADLDQNGADDFILASGFSLRILMHQTEAQGLTQVRMRGPKILTSADLDGDGDVDLVVEAVRGLAVLWNNGKGAFLRDEFWTKPDAQVLRVKAADFDGDGTDEVVVLSADRRSKQQMGELTLLRANKERGQARVIRTYKTLTDGVGNLGVGDLNGDGDLDLFTTPEQEVIVWLGDGNAGFAPQDFPMDAPVGVAELADVDGDGTAEIVATLTRQLADIVVLKVGRIGQLDMSSPVTGLEPLPLVMTAGDVDGDGIEDVVALSIRFEARVADSSVKLIVTEGVLTRISQNASGQLEATDFVIPSWQEGNTPWALTGLVVGQFDGEGLPDVGFTLNDIVPTRVLTQQDQAFGFAKEDRLPCKGGALFNADLDGNGQAELVISTIGTAYACILWNGSAQ